MWLPPRRSGILLQQGIGDTVRISLTPEPGGDRTLEVQVAQELLQTMGFRTFVPLVAGMSRLRPHHLDHVPGTGAQRSRISSAHEMPNWKTRYPGVESLNVAIMGCIVNGPGESKHADNRHLLARHRRNPGWRRYSSTARSSSTLRGPNISTEFQAMVIDYIDQRYGAGSQCSGKSR